MNSRYCLVEIKEEKGRVSTDFILQDSRGELTDRNNWTFDILTERLFRSMLKLILRHDTLDKCFLVMPEEGHFSKAIMRLDMNRINSLLAERGIEVEFIKDSVSPSVNPVNTSQPGISRPWPLAVKV